MELEPRNSSRLLESRQGAHHRTNTRGVRNYNLNLSKAILKKVQACDRIKPVHIKQTDGGLRILFQAGAYEAVRYSLSELYKTFDSSLILKSSDHDLKGNCVSDMYKIQEGPDQKDIPLIYITLTALP